VAYAFRPNDVVAQEKRRSLVGQTLIGRPLAMLEYFDANTALSLVLVNPAETNKVDPASEQALAARVYQRIGGLDLYGFARHGGFSGNSFGTSAAWVATDALELHGSLRWQERAPTLDYTEGSGLLATSNPWQPSWVSHPLQALIGATYTNEEQHSFILEAWWDGNAMSANNWGTWQQRNQDLRVFAQAMPSLQKPAAFNLAWQNYAFNSVSSMRRKNVFARWSWQNGAWSPSVDVLWTPEDQGKIWTAALAWQGDRMHVDAGLRVFAGPSKAIIAQLPDAKTAYISATWAF